MDMEGTEGLYVGEEGEGVQIVRRERDWVRRGAPKNGTEYSLSHLRWVRMGGRTRQFR